MTLELAAAAALAGQDGGDVRARQSGAAIQPFASILFPSATAPARGENREVPACFRDLGLDQVVQAVTAGRDEYDLAPLFCAPLDDLDAIAYRQEVFRDVETDPVAQAIRTFARRMKAMRDDLERSRKRYYRYERERWFLSAALVYREAVRALLLDLSGAVPRSRGLRAFRDHLDVLVASLSFARLEAEALGLKERLGAIRYSLLVRGSSVSVRPHEGEADYSAEVEATFERFRRAVTREYRAKPTSWNGMNHVEAQILDRVALLHPETFGALDAFCASHADYADPKVVAFDREIQFYLAYSEHVARIRGSGLAFCYPVLSSESKQVDCRNTFDLALAERLVREQSPVVTNDLQLHAPERLFVVSGPNQGGKTTFARTFGQLHCLAGLGCPVPGGQARLFLCDRVFTHFDREGKADSLRGKLQDDLIRIKQILDAASPRSVVILNEIFSSTTLADAVFLGRRVLGRLSARGVLGVCVTFLDELASFDETTVSVVSAVDPTQPARRTFKIERRPADGLAHALAIAEKHRVTRRWLEGRIRA